MRRRSTRRSRSTTRRPQGRRNPGYDPVWMLEFSRGGGGCIELYEDGEVVVMDGFDTVQDHYYVKPAFTERFKALVLADRFASWNRYTRDMVADDVEFGGRRIGKGKRQLVSNPRRTTRRPANLISQMRASAIRRISYRR